jgi:hypothetical protein
VSQVKDEGAVRFSISIPGSLAKQLDRMVSQKGYDNRSRVVVRWDGAPADSAFAWARDGRTRTVTLPAKAPAAGKRELAVGRQKLAVTVQPEP